MTSKIRKLVLTSHITFSVGWLGTVVVFLVLAIVGLTTMDNQLSRSALLAMEISAWFVIVPFCLISLFTGVVQALGTKWGLFKHYWIIIKLILTVISTILLLLHMQPISYLANIATDATYTNSASSEQLINIISKAGLAILVLVAITTISVYKPWGKVKNTQQNNIEKIDMEKKKKSLSFYILIGIISLIIIFIISHLFGGGMHGH